VKIRSVLPCLMFLAGANNSLASNISSVTDPTSNWTVAPTISLDTGSDQQTGQGDQDIVGTTQDAGFYTGFDGNNMYFRVRLGKLRSGGYSGLFWVGIDANGDGALDLFVGVNNQGSTTNIGFFAPGTGANTSPSTTSIANAVPQYQIAENSSNFDYEVVTNTIAPGVINTDINGDTNTDAMLSFRVPFAGASGTATLQGAFQGLANMSISTATLLSFVIATSTQANSLNQDLGGINGGVNSTTTFAALGALSPAVSTTLPEPATIGSFGAGLLLLTFIRNRQRR